jgi:hypothetical protein
MITDHGIFESYIELCSQLVQNLNFWVIMVDSVDLQVNLTVSREKGMIFGGSGRRYKINEAHSEAIFRELDAKHLARKATVVLLCHSSDHFAIPIACSTFISGKHDTVCQLLKDCLSQCIKHDINVQLLNSDGSNYSAVKEASEEYKIGAVNCSCHLGKNIRNPLKDDERTILVPAHKIEILASDKDITKPVKCIQEGVNFITVNIDGIQAAFDFQIILPGRTPTILFDAKFGLKTSDLYFNDKYESGFTFSSDKTSLSLSIYSLKSELDLLIFRSSATEASIECVGYVVQHVSMDTIRATYEDKAYGSLVQKLIPWEAMHVTDKMKESLMADICCSEYLHVLKDLFPQFPGLYNYLKMMNCVYHPSASDESIDIVIDKLDRAISIVESMRDLTKDLNGSFGVTENTYQSLILNQSGYKHIQQYMKNNNLSFSTRLLLTNRLEGLFSRCRLIMRRYLILNFIQYYDLQLFRLKDSTTSQKIQQILERFTGKSMYTKLHYCSSLTHNFFRCRIKETFIQ